MAYFNSWSSGLRVDPNMLFLLIAFVALACFLATPLTHMLLKYEDEELARAEARSKEIQGSVQDMPLTRRFIVPVLSIAFFVFLFYIGMRHY